MKKYVFIALAVIAIASTPFFAKASMLSDLWAQINALQAKIAVLLVKRASSTDVTAPFNNVSFTCDGGKTIVAKVEVRPKALGRVQLKLSDRKATLVLNQTRSGSGARYADKNETLVFWNKGDSAFIEEKGTTTFKNCVLSGNTKKNDNQVVCAQDAKQCPDGSYVGRIGPKCEFKCPNAGNQEKWQTYYDEGSGFLVSYPAGYRIGRKIKFTYPNGKSWIQVEVIDPTEKARLRIEANPDGYGPIFADKIWKVERQGDQLKIVKEQTMPRDANNEDGQTIIMLNSATSAGIDDFDWMTFYPDDQPDFGSAFRKMIESFKFPQNDRPDVTVARETLKNFFDYLNSGAYQQALEIFEPQINSGVGFDWEGLSIFSEPRERGYRDQVLANYCDAVGTCLSVKDILKEKSLSGDTFKFTVTFYAKDWSLYKFGPCCGASEKDMPTRTEFDFLVKKIDGTYKVITAPLYRP